jgi:FAD/FMN-containing dehydrogenase
VGTLHAQNPDLWNLAKKLKGALDPDGILAPGKSGL